MKKIYIAFLWHQHQPIYKNPTTGIYELPWVRLHATKDYYDTVAILDEFPQIRATYNLVPSLLIQLSEYAQGLARDRYLELTLKQPNDLTEEEKIFILHNFFMANWNTMIYPYPRYKQLLEKRGRTISYEELTRIQHYFKPQDIRDLQVWFNLSWMDPYWRNKDELIKNLFEKGRDFTEEEKNLLVKKQLEICGLIAGKYRQLQDEGRIEVSTSPFYHPILPLLCDTNNALGATPNITLPKKRFQHREDAKMQIMKSVDFYQREFGRPPKGMWPSEGSVSEDVIPLFAEAGIKWIASDESILFHTQPEFNGSRRKLYEAYKLEILNHEINILFRDHALSDAIGFVYSSWSAENAVSDFVKRIHAIRDTVCDSPGANIIPIILDGENCWEYYQNDGWDFLRLLFQTLSNDPLVETTTISNYLEQFPPKETLKRLWPGSWINANFNIWIGHPEDNLAWDYLYETRKFLADYIIKNPDKKDTPEIKSAWEKIYIAEGSDWNWWYGDEHGSGNDETFDNLFRQHLITIYELLNAKAPDHLYKAIKGRIRKQPNLEPIDFISPKIDGKITNYFEWQSAGFYKVGHSGGSMHQVETLINAFYYGFDLDNIYIRLDLNIQLNEKIIDELCFKIVFLKPTDTIVYLFLKPGGEIKEFYLQKQDSTKEPLSYVGVNKIIELAIPVKDLPLPKEENQIEFVITVEKNALEIERWPYQSSVIIPKPSEDFSLHTWSV